MLLSNVDTAQLIKKNNRHYQSRIRLELVNLNQDNSLATKTPYHRKGSFIEQIIQTDLSYQQQRLHIGMTLGHTLWPSPLIGMPNAEGYTPRTWAVHNLCGYVGLCQNDSIREEEWIFLRFAARSFKRLTVLFAPNRVPSKYLIQVLDRKEQLLWQQVYTNPSEKIEITLNLIVQAHKIALCILKRPSSGLRSHLLQLSPSYTICLGDFDISKFKIDYKYAEFYSGLGSACISTLDMSLFNNQRFYDLANTENPYYQNLRQGAIIHIDLQLKDHPILNLQGQILSLGSFYISSWSSQESDAQVKIQASDLLGFVKDPQLYWPLYEEISAEKAFTLFTQAIGLRECFIHGNLANLNLYNIAIDGKAGEIIQNLCSQTLSIAYINTKGKSLIVKQMQGLSSLVRYPLKTL